MAPTRAVHAAFVFALSTVCMTCTDDEFMQVVVLHVVSDLLLSSSQIVLLPAPRAILCEHPTATEGVHSSVTHCSSKLYRTTEQSVTTEGALVEAIKLDSGGTAMHKSARMPTNNLTTHNAGCFGMQATSKLLQGRSYPAAAPSSIHRALVTGHR